jgi:hypothetical protein
MTDILKKVHNIRHFSCQFLGRPKNKGKFVHVASEQKRRLTGNFSREAPWFILIASISPA